MTIVPGHPLDAALLMLRGQDLLLVIVLLVLLFGAKKIPDLAKGLGEGIRQFKHSVKDDEPKPEDKKPVV